MQTRITRKFWQMFSKLILAAEFGRAISAEDLRFYSRMNFFKKNLIDFAFQRLAPAPVSFADLGGVGNIDAVYTFYTLCRYKIKSAFLVDTDLTDLTLKKGRENPNLTIIKANFGETDIPERLGRVGAVFFFDMLLHQVKPDWDRILEVYSRITDCFVIYNQQYIQSEKTIRLLDLGIDEYFKNVPHARTDPYYKNLLEKMYEISPQRQCINRDVHDVWQWGITDRDLCAKMQELGFALKLRRNYGHFGNLANFENHGFVFQKTGLK